jgi:hypothetical protein
VGHPATNAAREKGEMMYLTDPTIVIEPLLERWANFYLLMAEASGALIGLLFVIVTFAAERRLKEGGRIRIYLTPTVIYFASVLYLAALLTFPNHTRLTATVCICVAGGFGLVYSGAHFVRHGIRKSYQDLGDWIFHAGLPFAAYGLVVWGAVLLQGDPQRGLTFVAAGMLSLLTISIRNSWAITVDVVTTDPSRP